jgi:hypothetical protein
MAFAPAVSNVEYGTVSGSALTLNMILPKLLSWVAALWRQATEGRVRRFCLVLLLLLLVLSSGIRVRSYLLTRRIQAVLFGLEQLKVDATSEKQLLQTVPYLIRDPESREGTHVRHHYRVRLSNEDDARWPQSMPKLFLPLWPPVRGEGPITDKWNAMDFALKAAYILGWRYLSFSADVKVLDGTVSAIWYGIEPDVFLGWPVSYLVVARSTHGFWRARGSPVPVSSADDESPDYRFGFVAGEFSLIAGADAAIGVAYTPQAGRERISHVYQVDLSCFWNLRGCSSARQVVPLLWKDRQEILAATAARLTPGDPCPDRILAGRVRSLPDLNVALLEVVRSRHVEINMEGDPSHEISTDYRLKEIILGHPAGHWTDMRYREAIRRPLSPTGEIANPMSRALPKAGERFLYFSGARFDSCRIVPARPSAEAAVRGAVPADRRSEDDISGMRGRM